MVDCYRFIKTTGKEGKVIGYRVQRLYKLHWRWGLDIFGFRYLKDRLCGGTIWYALDDDRYFEAIGELKELQKTHSFKIKVLK